MIISPEQCNGSKYSYKSDVWALGVILYEMINQGALPFKGKNIQLLFLNIQKGYYSPVKNVHHYSSQLVNLINSCLQTRPSKRPTLKEILNTPIIVKYIRQQMLTVTSTGELTLAQDQVEDTVLDGEMSNLFIQLTELGVLNNKALNQDPLPVPNPSVLQPIVPPNPNYNVAKKAVVPPQPRNQSPVPEKIPPKPQPKVQPSSRPQSSNNDIAVREKKIDSEIMKLQKEQMRIEKALEQMRKNREPKKEDDHAFQEFSKKFQGLNLPSKFEPPSKTPPTFTNEKERILFERQQKKIKEEEEQKQKLKEARVEYHASRVAAKNQHFNLFHNQHNIVGVDKAPKKEVVEPPKIPSVLDKESILQRQAEIDSEIEKEYTEMINLTMKKIETLKRKKESMIMNNNNVINQNNGSSGEDKACKVEDTMFGDSDDSNEGMESSEEEVEYETEEDSEDEEEEDYYEETDYDDIPVVGRLEDRVNSLIKQNEQIFGKERFEKLYAKYQELYNNDQIQNEEAKIIPRKEVLGDDEPQLRKYCHLIEELIFVQSALL